MRVPEILQIETPHSPGALASVLNVAGAAIAADGQSVLCFPGLFDGALRERAREFIRRPIADSTLRGSLAESTAP